MAALFGDDAAMDHFTVAIGRLVGKMGGDTRRLRQLTRRQKT